MPEFFSKKKESHYLSYLNYKANYNWLNHLPYNSDSSGSVTPSLKKSRHPEYLYANVLYISEAHRWSDEHAVSCVFTRYTWPSRQRIVFLNRWNQSSYCCLHLDNILVVLNIKFQVNPCCGCWAISILCWARKHIQKWQWQSHMQRSLFLLSITWLPICWSHDQYHLVILSFSLLFWHSTLSMPILSCYYLGSPFLLSCTSIFHLIITASYLLDYPHTFHIPSYCSTFHSHPIGHSAPLISWHYILLSFLLSSEHSLRSYW